MNFIIFFLTSILGNLMNVFYLLLDFIGTPYIWICIVLFSLVTRFLFLPGKIKGARKKKLKRVIDSEIADVHYRYLNSEDTKETKKAQKRETKAIYKKYRVSQGAGCLSTLLQLPIYIALYNVVVSPNLYVPEIKKLYVDEVGNADMIATIQNFFGLDIGLTPLNLGGVAYIFPLIVCLFATYKSYRTLKGQKFSGPKKAFFRWYVLSMQILQVVVFTCFSFKFPLGISIYWLTNDMTNFVIDYFVTKSVNNNQSIKDILAAYEAKRTASQATSSDNTPVSEEDIQEESDKTELPNNETNIAQHSSVN
ncbi:MAG: membrane protein insertase YidC [Lachnospiraceae bacterium]|nr:membrane protein insertase YidC [Lachnospiraceae bacterium]